MRLFEHPDFDQAILQAARANNVSEQFIEKDYYVTEILRIVAQELGPQTIFKGGTSLSKGWKLIDRFSEDIDLFLNRASFNPPLSNRKVDQTLGTLARAVSEHPALQWLEDESESHSGKDRADYFSYRSHFDDLPGIRAAVLLEPGIQSGDFPTETRPISSLVANHIGELGLPLDAEDMGPFDMELMHFRRTFVEKMFTIHGKVIRLIEEGRPVGRDSRHYADLFVLAGTPEVKEMLESAEYGDISQDYGEKSQEFYAKSYRPPDGLSFANSPALFPPEGIRDQLAADYEQQCGRLFSGGEYPPFDEALGRFEEIRTLL